MVDIKVQVHHPLVVLEKFENAQDNVIDVTKPGCFCLLRMVQSSSPVDGDVSCAAVEPRRAANGSTSRDLRYASTVVREALEASMRRLIHALIHNSIIFI